MLPEGAAFEAGAEEDLGKTILLNCRSCWTVRNSTLSACESPSSSPGLDDEDEPRLVVTFSFGFLVDFSFNLFSLLLERDFISDFLSSGVLFLVEVLFNRKPISFS